MKTSLKPIPINPQRQDGVMKVVKSKKRTSIKISDNAKAALKKAHEARADTAAKAPMIRMG